MTQTLVAPQSKIQVQQERTEARVVNFAALSRTEQLRMLERLGYDRAAALEVRAVTLEESRGDRIDLRRRQRQPRAKKA